MDIDVFFTDAPRRLPADVRPVIHYHKVGGSGRKLVLDARKVDMDYMHMIKDNGDMDYITGMINEVDTPALRVIQPSSVIPKNECVVLVIHHHIHAC